MLRCNMSNPIGIISLVVIGVVALATFAYQYLNNDEPHNQYRYHEHTPPHEIPLPNRRPIKTIKKRNGNCSICLHIINNGTLLSCGHLFHLQCITQWHNRTKNCPECRANSYIIQ